MKKREELFLILAPVLDTESKTFGQLLPQPTYMDQLALENGQPEINAAEHIGTARRIDELSSP